LVEKSGSGEYFHPLVVCVVCPSSIRMTRRRSLEIVLTTPVPIR